MRLLCIKDIVYHWGSEFTKGDYYEIKSFETTGLEIVTNYKDYSKHMDEFLKRSFDIGHGAAKLTDEQISKHVENNNLFEHVQEKYVRKIDIQCVTLESNLKSKYRFLLTNLQKIKEEYQFPDPDFNNSYYLLEGYFDCSILYRKDKLKRILND